MDRSRAGEAWGVVEIYESIHHIAAMRGQETKDNKFGECCICGFEGQLSFEHVPPQAAFNDMRVFEADIKKLFGSDWLPGEPVPAGRYKQRGVGNYTLCVKCNNATGDWYGAAYVDFVRQAMTLMQRSNGRLSGACRYEIYPLRVLKQIIAMFFSACGPKLRSKHPDLVRFVLNREVQDFPKNIQIWGYLLDAAESIATRQSGVTGLLQPKGTFVYSEIAFPPFGWIMSFDRQPVDAQLYNLTHFHTFGINHRERVDLKFPLLAVVTQFPGDFRTVDEVRETVRENSMSKIDS